MSDQKKTPKSIAVLAQLVNGIQSRVLWLSDYVRRIDKSVDWVRDEIRLKTGSLQHSVADVREKVDQTYDQLGKVIDGISADAGVFAKLKAEVERQRILGVQRADLSAQNLQEFKDATVHALQKLNERVSAVEGIKAPLVPNAVLDQRLNDAVKTFNSLIGSLQNRLDFAEIANRDNAKIVNSHGDRLKAHGEHLQTVETRLNCFSEDITNLFSSRQSYQAAVNKDITGVLKALKDLTTRHETLTDSVGYALDRINNPASKWDANQFVKSEPGFKFREHTAGVTTGGTPGTLCEGDNNLASVKVRNVDRLPALFTASTKEGLYKALPGILRLLNDKSLVRSVEEAGFKVSIAPIIDLVQELVDERSAAQESKKSFDVTKFNQGLPG